MWRTLALPRRGTHLEGRRHQSRCEEVPSISTSERQPTLSACSSSIDDRVGSARAKWAGRQSARRVISLHQPRCGGYERSMMRARCGWEIPRAGLGAMRDYYAEKRHASPPPVGLTRRGTAGASSSNQREFRLNRLRKKSVGGASSPIRRLLPLRNPLI